MTRRSVLAAVVLLGSTACLDLTTDPEEIVAIELDPLPWPSIVAGDTLRGPTGTIAPLTARLFKGDGSEVTGGEVEFFATGTGLTVTSGHFVVASETATGAGTIRASTSGVQSAIRQLDVIPQAPDSMVADGTITPVEWVVPDNAQSNISVPLGVQVLSTDGTTATGVRSWIVTFELKAGNAPAQPGDTTGVYLVGDAGRPSYADTTDSQGKASRRVRIRIAPGFSPPDSAVVTVTASSLGAVLRGGPVRLVLPLRPR